MATADLVADVHQRDVPRNPDQPDAEARLRAVVGNAAVGLEEGVLRQVLDHVPVADIAGQVGPDPGLVLADDHRERLRGAFPAGLQQRFRVVHFHTPNHIVWN